MRISHINSYYEQEEILTIGCNIKKLQFSIKRLYIKTKYAEFVWAALRRRSIFMRKFKRKRREQYFRNF